MSEKKEKVVIVATWGMIGVAFRGGMEEISVSYNPELEGDEFTAHFVTSMRGSMNDRGGLEMIEHVMIGSEIGQAHFIFLLSALQALGLK
ncbi:hypothetical protein HOI83_00935, partial [Candidatus Uhrbacteria bacterium]|nr:hypothetical protein [Candidatus Uhrbacteria bacterium]